MDKRDNNYIFSFLIFWSALNLIQSSLTGLSHDEAYYWMYSRFLNWGYFDHPPATAVMIKLGYFILKSELGVRLFTVIFSSSTIYLLYLLCKPRGKDQLLFFAIVTSIPLVHAGGFLAAPDIPFIFFTTAFLYIFDKYLKEDSLNNSCLLALMFACIMYSKYHGVLVILFSLIANPNILTRKSLWIAAFASILLFAPHIWWQYVNDFPSIKYHLFERSTEEYKLSFTLEYLGGQILILGPFTGFILLFSSFKLKSGEAFHRTLKINLAGILIFFLISSFRSKVEANWTSAAFIPAIILSFSYLRNALKIKKWFISLVIPTLVLLITARLILMLDHLPLAIKVKSEFYGWKSWAKQIEEKAGEVPVIFMNSYQQASKYTFYTGKTTHTLNNYMYRKNQYNIWPIEDSLQGKKVFLIPNYESGEDTFRNVFGEKYCYIIISNFRSFNKIKIKPLKVERFKCVINEKIKLNIQLINKGSYDADFSANQDFPTSIYVNIYLKGIYQSSQSYTLKSSLIKVNETFNQEVEFTAPAEKGKYSIRIVLQTGWLPSGLNSDLIPLEITL